MRPRLVAVTFAAALLALTACSSGGDDAKPTDPTRLDAPARQACDDLAHGLASAKTTSEQQALYKKVDTSARKSHTNGIASESKSLGDGVAGDTAYWQTHTDALTRACVQAGWKP
ncbi:hypothetical protein [Actinacidiphila bryophytorum]|uniref:Lipoprotein n=1 Tax=Actinacidiphila bryophytorum TaxID=1436133 RepID=A0A9W4GZT0_9ACTN|nr:hypothetical protein [Actinacidiphila bryophytorum]MBM9436117.1 hypothetical protein [Actinacidiphila bryophytorum]MBN6543728.1 hypothetical protein [Actinacidiphila bryophytorum]CAG7634123.1 conserved exported hypothetical protein [Actinacidiphila bryophytorum]